MPERTITVRIQGVNDVGPTFQAVRAELAALEQQAARTTITPGAAIGTSMAAQAAQMATFSAETKSAAESWAAFTAQGMFATRATTAATEATAAFTGATKSAADSYAVFAQAGLVAAASNKAAAVSTATVAAEAVVAETEVRRLSQAFGLGAEEARGFETVMARRLLPTIGLVSLNAGTIAAAGVLALGAGFALAAAEGIKLDATLEQETLRFRNFGMSAGQAQAHVQELFKLGAATPFTAEQLIQASRTLEVFGRGALDTEANLRLLGDTSAATGADLQALTFWVGRLYADLQAGKPIGEAEQNLRQLAVLTPEASRALEGLAAQPNKGTEAFAAFAKSLQGFTGAMEAQSHTLVGLTSTLADNLGQLAGIAFAPIFDANKSALEGFNAALTGPEATQSARDLATALAGIVGAIGGIAAVWNALPADLRAYLMGGPLSQAMPGIRAATSAGAAVVGGQSILAGTTPTAIQDEFAFRRDLAARLATIESGMTVQVGAEPLDRAALAQQLAFFAPTPGGPVLASGAGGQAAGLLRPAGPQRGAFALTAEASINGITDGLVGMIIDRAGRDAQELADRQLRGRVGVGPQRDLNPIVTAFGTYLVPQAAPPTGMLGQADAEFGRRAGAGPESFAAQMATARAAALGQTAQDRLAADRAAIVGREGEYARTQQQVGIERELAALEADRLRAKATGSISAERADERDIARQQDALSTLRLRSQNERELQSAIEAQNAAVVALDQATHDQNQAGIAAANQQIKGWGDQVIAIKAAGAAIKDVTDAQQALNARMAEWNFQQGQERARGGIATRGLGRQEQAFSRDQDMLAQQQLLSNLEVKRANDQARGDQTAVARDDRQVRQQQNHIKYLQDVSQQDDRLFQLQQERATFVADLLQAEHDGNVAAAESLRDRIRMEDDFIAKVNAAKQAIREEKAAASEETGPYTPSTISLFGQQTKLGPDTSGSGPGATITDDNGNTYRWDGRRWAFDHGPGGTPAGGRPDRTEYLPGPGERGYVPPGPTPPLYGGASSRGGAMPFPGEGIGRRVLPGGGVSAGDLGVGRGAPSGGAMGDFHNTMNIYGDVDRPTAQEIIDAVMGIHRQATMAAIASSGSLVPA